LKILIIGNPLPDNSSGDLGANGRQSRCFCFRLGSGGTLAGIGKFIKEKIPRLKLLPVEPKNVSALLGHEPGLHKFRGLVTVYSSSPGCRAY
jgi:cysteine synthase